MKRLLETLIIFYQRTPALHRRTCLFRESCSHYVLRRLREDGGFAACRAFFERWTKCRPGYRIHWDLYSGVATVRLADGSEIPKGEMGSALLSRVDAAFQVGSAGGRGNVRAPALSGEEDRRRGASARTTSRNLHASGHPELDLFPRSGSFPNSRNAGRNRSQH